MNDPLFEQLKEVRDSGETNMLQWGSVYRIACDSGYSELIIWMENHDTLGYFHMLTGSFSEWLENGEGES